MLWLLQLPAPLLGCAAVAVVVVLSVGGFDLVPKSGVAHPTRDANEVSGQVFQLAGVLYAVLVAFVVVVVWEQFGDAENATEAEASAIADLLRDSTAIPRGVSGRRSAQSAGLHRRRGQRRVPTHASGRDHRGGSQTTPLNCGRRS